MSDTKTITVKKGESLQRQGDIDTKIYKIKSGLLRSYSIDEKGKEHIFLFAPERTVMVDHLPPNLPADLYIDALEDTTVTVHKKTITMVSKNPHELIKRMDALQKRVIMLMSSSIIERYQHFIKSYPQIVERVPQKMIASYLGVTPEALSKAKRQYLKRN